MTSSIQEGVYRGGSGEPMVLIHVGANPWHKWESLLPELTRRYDVLVPTLPGFAGGPVLRTRATIDMLTDAVEDALDRAGFSAAHCVGNSLGGWIAMELARRGRATTALALSPAGGWETRWARARVKAFFRTNFVLTQIGRPLLPLVMHVPQLRWMFLRMTVQHPLRLSPRVAALIATDTMSGGMLRALGVADDSVQPYPDPGVPTMIAWSVRDRLTPLKSDGQVWRRSAPSARWRVLEDVGHMPMYDDPGLVLDTILDAACAAS